jgi:hypothetical protein
MEHSPERAGRLLEIHIQLLRRHSDRAESESHAYRALRHVTRANLLSGSTCSGPEIKTYSLGSGEFESRLPSPICGIKCEGTQQNPVVVTILTDRDRYGVTGMPRMATSRTRPPTTFTATTLDSWSPIPLPPRAAVQSSTTCLSRIRPTGTTWSRRRNPHRWRSSGWH